MAMLEVKHIEKHFGDTKVLNDISFSLEQGDVVSIIGHNEDEEFLNFIFNGNANVRKTPHFYHGDIILDGKLKMTVPDSPKSHSQRFVRA